MRAAYKQHLGVMTARVNSLTGVAYKDDGTIIGWCVAAAAASCVCMCRAVCARV